MPTRLLIVVLGLVACSGEPTNDAGTDAGTDTGPDSGALDTGTDVGPDAPDAVADGGPADPVWTRLPGYSDDCYVEYAAHPERFISVSWSACPPTLGTCTYARITPLRMSVLRYPATWDPAGARWLFSIGMTIDAPPATDGYFAIVGSDGSVIAATHDHSADIDTATCTSTLAAGPSTIAMRADYFSPTARPPLPVHLLRGSFASWFDQPLLLGELETLAYPAFAQELMTSDTATVSKIVPAEYLLFSRSASPVARHTPGYESIHRIVGDHVFWSSAGDDGTQSVRLYHTGPSDVDDLLLDGVAVHEDYFDLDATEHDLAWYVVTSRATDGTPTGGNLMTAAFATTAADLVPRVLRSGCTGGECLGPRIGPDAIAYDYLTAAPELRDTLDVISMADGSRARFVLPTSPRSWSFSAHPLWIDENDVAVPATGDAVGNTLLRVPRTSLTPVP